MNKGAKIEKESFNIIESRVDLSRFSQQEKLVVKRIIHASGDFEFANLVVFSKNWLSDFKEVVKHKPAIVCDVNMVKAGITQRYLTVSGLKSYCFISDDKIKKIAEDEGKTRAEASIEHAFDIFDSAVFVIGNAPTALLKVLDLQKEKPLKHIFVVGFPVGFVKAAYSKELLAKSDLGFVTNRGTKGGSGVATAAFNAMIKVCYGV